MGQLSWIGSIVLYISAFGLPSLLSKVKFKSKFFKYLLIILPPVLIATFRYNVGYDYGSYIWGYYNSFVISFDSIISGYESGDPIAFYLIQKILTFFSSERIYLMILSLIALLPGLLYILKEWDNKETKPLMVFMYLFGPYLFSFSAAKQGIALSILMFSLKYVFQRKPLKFVSLVFVAFLFHSTAIVFLPVYFFLNSKGALSLTRQIVIISACMLVIMNLQTVLGSVMDGRYEGYATNIVEGNNRTFWLYLAMTIFFLFFRKKLVAIDERNDLFIMMMVVGVLCQYLGFTNAFTKRIGEYFLLAEIFLLPQCIYLFTKDSRPILKILILIYVVLIFLISSPVTSSGMGFVPYQYKFW